MSPRRADLSDKNNTSIYPEGTILIYAFLFVAPAQRSPKEVSKGKAPPSVPMHFVPLNPPFEFNVPPAAILQAHVMVPLRIQWGVFRWVTLCFGRAGLTLI